MQVYMYYNTKMTLKKKNLATPLDSKYLTKKSTDYMYSRYNHKKVVLHCKYKK